jgi:hypothetical protein
MQTLRAQPTVLERCLELLQGQLFRISRESWHCQYRFVFFGLVLEKVEHEFFSRHEKNICAISLETI